MVYNAILYHIQFLKNIINEIEIIINKYNVYIKHNGESVYYYKIVKSKYWHTLYYYYQELCESKNLPIEDKKLNEKINLFIGVIPCLINIDKVQNKKRFNIFDKFYYDFIKLYI